MSQSKKNFIFFMQNILYIVVVFVFLIEIRPEHLFVRFIQTLFWLLIDEENQD